jgi:hypothetical protein
MVLSSTWRGHSEVWRQNGVRPPWVPTEEDVLLMQRACPELASFSEKTKVLVLGVTPAVVMARWLEGFEVKAVDYDPDMIAALWQPEAGDRAEAICADWSAMPFPDDEFDLVVGDSSFCALPSLSHYRAVLAEIMRVKRPEAPIITRFFLRPDNPPAFSDIVDPGGTLLLKEHEQTELRFLTIMAACDPDGIMDHQQIAQKIRSRWGDLDAYIDAVSSDEAEASRYRLAMERTQCLNFPSLGQIRDQAGSCGLSPTVFLPTYRLAAFCPTIRFD